MTKESGKPPRAKQTTRAEREYRRRKLVQLIKLGWDNAALRDYACDEFGCSERSARSAVDAAYQSISAAMGELNNRRIAAIVLARFEAAYRLAAAQRNPMAMVAANAHIANIWVKHAPEITVSDNRGTDQRDPEEDF